MRSPRVNLAYTQNINTCLAVENHRPCPNNPRWIEEDWQPNSVRDLRRARNDLENHWGSFDHEHRVERSKALIHGQVCRDHEVYSKRLQQAVMIRGYARDDRKGPRSSKRKANPRRRCTRTTGSKTKKATTAMHHQTPEMGRTWRYSLDAEETMDDTKNSVFIAGFGFTPRSITPSSSGLSPMHRLSINSDAQRINSTPGCQPPTPKDSISHTNDVQLQPITPDSAIQTGGMCRYNVANTLNMEASFVSKGAMELDSLMHHNHHLQHEYDIASLESEVYQNKLDKIEMQAQIVSCHHTISDLQTQITSQGEQMSQLHKKIAGLESLAAVVRKFNGDSSAYLENLQDQ